MWTPRLELALSHPLKPPKPRTWCLPCSSAACLRSSCAKLRASSYRGRVWWFRKDPINKSWGIVTSYPPVNKHSYGQWPFIVDLPAETIDFLYRIPMLNHQRVTTETMQASKNDNGETTINIRKFMCKDWHVWLLEKMFTGDLNEN